MNEVLQALSTHFQSIEELQEIELLTTEQREYAAPAVAMVSAVDGFPPVPINLRRLERFADSTRFSKASLLLALANYRKLSLRGSAAAFGHHNKMRTAECVAIDKFAERAEWMIDNSREMLAVSSRFRSLDGEERNFLLIDFACKNDDVGRKSVTKVLEVLSLKGLLIDSGNSYHFYSEQHFAFVDWVKKMGEVLLFSPIVDGAWVAHQLIEGRSALRISAKGSKLLKLVSNI